jgi:hypothetical protein|tara:strand:+ start:450 stop:1481 length:1032 start_codon:yes stop_codon:yes gene_type:complete
LAVGLKKRRDSALDRFYDRLPYKPFCGDDKAAILIRPLDQAAEMAYIQPNAPEMASWIVIDLDHSDSWQWEERGIPAPNLIVRNPANGHSHLYYAIIPVCTSENARHHPIRYMQAVARGLAAALTGGDLDYTGRIAKNPLSEVWQTTEIHSHEYELGELADSIEPISKAWWSGGEEDSRGRNCALFNCLRRWAYTVVLEVKRTGTWEQWHSLVLSHAETLQPPQDDFPYSEIKATAKSVAKWCWANYTGSQVNRGVMALDQTDLPLVNRQRLSARRTHKARTDATTEKLVRAINSIVATGKRPSKAAVARLSGVSRSQIIRGYGHLFDAGKSVAYGVHQITAR